MPNVPHTSPVKNHQPCNANISNSYRLAMRLSSLKYLTAASSQASVCTHQTTNPVLTKSVDQHIPSEWSTPQSVVFISQPKGLISACWGGLMSTRAQKLGASGVVIDGKFRDISEHRELGFGLAARGISVLGSNTFTRSSEINVPVTYGIDE